MRFRQPYDDDNNNNNNVIITSNNRGKRNAFAVYLIPLRPKQLKQTYRVAPPGRWREGSQGGGSGVYCYCY